MSHADNPKKVQTQQKPGKQRKKMIAQRAAEMTSFIVMDVLEKAHEMERSGIDVIHLEVG
jgi:hypothetical protein